MHLKSAHKNKKDALMLVTDTYDLWQCHCDLYSLHTNIRLTQSRASDGLEEAGLEFDGGRRLHTRLRLSRRRLGFTVGLSGSDGRLEAGLEFWCRPHNSLEGDGVQRADVHQVLEGELMQAFGAAGGGGEAGLVQQVWNEGRDQQCQ